MHGIPELPPPHIFGKQALLDWCIVFGQLCMTSWHDPFSPLHFQPCRHTTPKSPKPPNKSSWSCYNFPTLDDSNLVSEKRFWLCRENEFVMTIPTMYHNLSLIFKSASALPLLWTWINQLFWLVTHLCWNRLDELVLITLQKTEFDTHHGIESCEMDMTLKLETSF